VTAHFPKVRRPGVADAPAVGPVDWTTTGAGDPPDVLLVGPGAVLDEHDRAALAGGTGLVVLGAGGWSSELLDVVLRAGVTIAPRAPEPGPLHADRTGLAAVGGIDLLARVVEPSGTAGARVADPAGAAFLRTADGSSVTGVGTTAAGGRVVVVAADLTDDVELTRNLLAWAAPRAAVVHRAASTAPIARDPAWAMLLQDVAALQPLQNGDGSVAQADREQAVALVRRVADHVGALAGHLPHDAAYLAAVVADLRRWAETGLGVPDFLDSILDFAPASQRVDGLVHLVVFPMYTQNGSRDRHLEVVLLEVVWPEFVARQEAGRYSNKLFVPVRFLGFSAGYDTNSAVLFPETVAMRSVPAFTWGAIFADREAARFRRVVLAAAQTTGLALPPDAERLLRNQELAEETFVLWDLIHDRTHMRGDLPFDPFMIKQRMPYFLYALEELRCDLTAFRESVRLEQEDVPHARLVQYGVLFDRIFRFSVTGSRVRNYDGLAGQLLFAWLHQHHVLHWTDNRLSVDWELVPDVVLALGQEIEDLYWRSIDRPKIAHWLAAYDLVAGTLTPHPSSIWARGPGALPLDGPLGGLTDALLPDEFPLSMFYEALSRKISDVVTSTSGITGATPDEA